MLYIQLKAPFYGSRVGNLGGLTQSSSSVVNAYTTKNSASPSRGVIAVRSMENSAMVESAPTSLVLSSSTLEVDSAAEIDLKENGYRSTRRTKLICTVGPATCSFEQLESLAQGGMNVARLNMCHGTHDWHRGVIESIHRLNSERGYCVAIMMDTEGSEIHLGDFGGTASLRAEDGEHWTFTVRKFGGEDVPDMTIQVNYDGFVDDVLEGDELVVDGGMVSFEVLRKIGPDVVCRCSDPGLLLPRANLTFFRRGRLVRERNAMLPTVSSKDWIDIDFGLSAGVDFIAVSFVKSPDVITHLKSYVSARSPNRTVGIIAKIESVDSLQCLDDIIAVSDGAMVARGDLGAQIPLEQVPSVQQKVVHLCRFLNKPVIVASQLLESMVEFPTPTRAEVADVSDAVRQKADALMLSGESAMGRYPEKALSVLRTVALRIEAVDREALEFGAGTFSSITTDMTRLPDLSTQLPERISEIICSTAAQMASIHERKAQYIKRKHVAIAYALRIFLDGFYLPSWKASGQCHLRVHKERSNGITLIPDLRCRLNMYWGLIPFRIDFSDDLESTLHRTFQLLKARGMLSSGDLIITVSDMSYGMNVDILQSVQIRRVP